MENKLPIANNPLPQDAQPKYCPECFHQMGRHGRIISGRKRVQRWLCSNCLRTTVKPLTAEQVKEQASPNRLHDALAKITKEKADAQ